MTQYVLVADGYRRVTKWTETWPKEALTWVDYAKGAVIDLDPDNDEDKLDIERLANVAFRPALVEKSRYDAVNQANARAALAVAAARAATLVSPFSGNPHVESATDEESGPFPEGSRVDAAGSTVGAGGTDPEPQGFTGEAAGGSYDDDGQWSYSDLQQAARSRGLSAGGARVDLVARLREFDALNGSPLAQRAAEGTLDDDDKEAALNT